MTFLRSTWKKMLSSFSVLCSTVFGAENIWCLSWTKFIDLVQYCQMPITCFYCSTLLSIYEKSAFTMGNNNGYLNNNISYPLPHKSYYCVFFMKIGKTILLHRCCNFLEKSPSTARVASTSHPIHINISRRTGF